MSRNPVVIALNRRPTDVPLTPKAFNRLAERARLIAAVQEELADAEVGYLFDDDAFADASSGNFPGCF